jgi:hypothetical protein
MESKSPKLNVQIIWILIVVGLLVGCSSTKVGELVGVKFTMGLSDIADGVIDSANFGGVVVVELEDGTKVNAIWDKSLGDQITGGTKLEVAPTDDPDFWKVIRIVETP